MEDWRVVEVIHMLPKGISYLGKQGKRKVGWQFGTVLGGGRPKGIMGLPYMASNRLIFKGFFGKAQTFKRAKGRSLVQS